MLPSDSAVPDSPPDSLFPDLSAEATMAQIEPHNDKFHEIFTKAVATFNKLPPEFLLAFMRWPRTFANCIWALAIIELEKAFPEGSPVKLKEEIGSVTIHFGPNLIARLKKMRPDGFTSNYPTRRARAYHGGEQGELFRVMWAKPCRVDIGYILNETATGVKSVMVARRRSPKVMDWAVPIPSSQTPVVWSANRSDKSEKTRVKAKRKDIDVAKES